MNKFWIFIILCFLFHSAASQSIVKTLPGYSGDLPFKLETGYVSVGKSEEINLFYYFIESERNPQEDPLVLWLTGGPGCSGLYALAFEIGPIAFDTASFNGGLPSFIPRQPSWTKIASVIFIDSPVGIGFSYTTQAKSYYTSDTLSAKYTYEFLRKWLLNHPMFIKNRLYISGDSYGGKMVPLVVWEISKGNEAGLEPQMSLQGYSVGNPVTDLNQIINERIPYAHGMALISDEYYEAAKSSCFGNYVNPDPSNGECLRAIELYNNCTSNLYGEQILEIACLPSTTLKKGVMFLEDDRLNILLSQKLEKTICRDDMSYMVSYNWANDPAVQDALHVRKGTINKAWGYCYHLGPLYEYNVESVVPYHQLLTEKNYQALVYSGDHDLIAPYSATLKWVKQLNLTLDEAWRPWNLNGQIAGYTQRYKKNDVYVTFATVKGAGHTAPEFKPDECYAMIDRWFSSLPL